MLTKDFYFDLPEELIAQHPSNVRGEDRLMYLNKTNGNVEHYEIYDLPNLIDENTLMVFNNSRVRRSRVYGIKESTNKKVEFIFLNSIDKDCRVWNVMVKNAKKQKPQMTYKFLDGSIGEIIENEKNIATEFRSLKFNFAIDENWFERNGHIPLPPYIKREDTQEDSERYQNVYSKEIGSSACPTAGLHFTDGLLNRLKEKKIDICYVTLHVGLGTFLPVREKKIENHKMHEEFYTITEETAKKINKAKKTGKKILAVGTTSVRTLESASDENGFVKAGTSSTRIFMYPGYKFKIVNQMITNFHTPESTLIMLVCAFAGKEQTMNAYKVAVENRYNFFSYGDAMLIK
ncbi:MAG: tRNA preQ1(34) S-adenosylmethionine ribosyltransferase-isomerase QueA [Treponema sp.]|nr:tRNA preQ1(34) S-adenosylmethionine ribosyltransferase-isomerase QueA [Treponema sp.]